MAVLAIWLLPLAGCSTPQLGNDPQVFKAVDALYTAVCARRVDLLAQCESDLESLRASGKISDPVDRRLSAVLTAARSNQWEAAAQKLARFMEQQRLGT